MNVALSERRPFVSVPLVLLAGVSAGILGMAGAWWGLFLLLGVCIWSRTWPTVVLCIVGLGLGYWRAASTTVGEPLAAQYGQMVQMQGHWDGRYLWLDQPKTGVALSPRPEQAAGDMRVHGVLRAPMGQRNFSGFDYRAYLQHQGVTAELSRAKIDHYQPQTGIVADFRAHFIRGLKAGLNPEQQALMLAIQLGDRQDIQDAGWQDDFNRAGLAHLMALSGQHVAILVAVLGVLLVPLGLWRYPVLLVFLGLYLLLVGTAPSIVRAILQGATVLLALWLGRGQLDTLGSMALAGLVSLLIWPMWLWDVGFQLSYLAVLGLVYAPRLAERLPLPWDWLKQGIALTLAPSLTTLPLVAHTFGQVPWIGLISNLFCELLMLALVPLGLLVGVFGGAVAWLNSSLVAGFCNALLLVVELFGRVQPLPWGHIEPLGWLVYGLWLWALGLWLYHRIAAGHFALISLCSVLITWAPQQLFPKRELIFLDVGQGDSTLIDLPHFAMLIDGGGTPRSEYDVGEKLVVPALRAQGVFALDVVVATHPDADHIEGLQAVLQNVPVGELWVGDAQNPAPLLQNLVHIAAQRGIRVREMQRGDTFSQDGVRFEVLFPSKPFREASNDNSIVFRVSSGTFVAGLMADLPTPYEEQLGMGPLTLLKVGHHGSRHSSSPEFLAETRPKEALISSGENTYGHPTPQTLARLAQIGARVWRTDQQGALRVRLP